VSRIRRLAGPTALSLVMFVTLIALGNWQIRRLAWKERILAQIAAGEAAPAHPLPPGMTQPVAFEKIAVRGRLRPDLAAWYGIDVRDTPQGRRMGAQVLEPLERADAAPLLVDLGWMPLPDPPAPPHPPATAAMVEIAGYARAPDRAGWFTPHDEAAARHFYALDPAPIAAALGLPRVAPFTLVALGPALPGVYPAPAQHLPQPPNDHFIYALTWYSLAGVLFVVFALWLAKSLRG